MLISHISLHLLLIQTLPRLHESGKFLKPETKEDSVSLGTYMPWLCKEWTKCDNVLCLPVLILISAFVVIAVLFYTVPQPEEVVHQIGTATDTQILNV